MEANTMARSRLDRILSSANSMDILLYIHSHPGCRKSDVYNNVTRNVHTLDKIHEFRDCGIVEMDENGNRAFLYMTEKGEKIAEALLRIRELLGEDH